MADKIKTTKAYSGVSLPWTSTQEVIDFQKANGLVVDGIVGPKTYGKWTEQQSAQKATTPTIDPLSGIMSSATSMVDENTKAQQSAIQSALDAQLAGYGLKKTQSQDEAKSSAKSAYVDYAKLLNPYGIERESLAKVGLGKSGLAETSVTSAFNTYQNQATSIANNLRNVLAEYDVAMSEAKANADYEKAQAATDAMNAKIELMLKQYEYAYQAQRDAVADSQWQKEFDYTTSKKKTLGRWSNDDMAVYSYIRPSEDYEFIKDLQDDMKSDGYYNGISNGIWNADTERAYRHYIDYGYDDTRYYY